MAPTTTKWMLALLVLLSVAGSVALFVSKRGVPNVSTEEPEPYRPSLEAFFAGIADPDYAVRFQRAMELIASQQEGLDARLDEILSAVPGADPARAALDFVRWKRSGKPLPTGASQKGIRPNILLISIDTLRADHLGCYGYERPTSPNIDALAAKGVLFENAFSPTSWTLPGHMSMLTSLYPSFHKLVARRNGARLHEAELTLAELLSSVGYRTAAFVNHPYLAAEWGFDQGFDLYLRKKKSLVLAEAQTQSAIDWVEWHLFHQHRGLEPSAFFLFVHYMDPHETYDAPPPFRDRYTGQYDGTLRPPDHFVTMFKRRDFPSKEDYRYVLALYDGEISYVDQAVGRLWKRLDDLRLLDSMVVVLTSDHGEEFKEHGGMGHKSTIYREQLHVPLVITYPPKIAPGQRVSSQASLVDIYPTVVGLIGEDVPAQAQGTDLTSSFGSVTAGGRLTSSKRAPTQAVQFAELGPPRGPWEGRSHLRAVRTNKYRLVADLARGTNELYDVQADPEEQRDLYRSKRDSKWVRDLQQHLTTFMQGAAGYNPEALNQDAVEVDERTQQQLRALGYVD
jgi:arylsulfatase A-like enzyme